jgi:6,7-dimethyl-8-ribityllumazine synthase
MAARTEQPAEPSPESADPADRFAIVVSQWNSAVTDKLLEGARASLQAAGAADQAITVAHVPGAWEIPIVAQRLARSGRYAAVICLGAVIRGETSHDRHINRGVTLALQKIALDCDLPVLLGLLTCESTAQALDRAGGKHGNKGAECADAALRMIGLLKRLPRS